MSFTTDALNLANHVEPAMPMNRNQLQSGGALPDFFVRCGTEAQPEAELLDQSGDRKGQ